MNRNTKLIALPTDADKLSAEVYRAMAKRFDNLWVIRLHKNKYTVREIAEILELSRSVVFRAIAKAKELKHIKKYLSTK